MNDDPHDWHADTRVLHGDSGLSDDSSVVAPIHYSATFRARDAGEFADMATRARAVAQWEARLARDAREGEVAACK